MKKTSQATILFLLSAFAISLHAEGDEQCAEGHHHAIDWSMRKDMYQVGSFNVSDADGNKHGTFFVNYLPGQTNILNDGGAHLQSALDTLKPFLEGEKFWQNEIWGSFTRGITWAHETSMESGIGAIPRDFQALWADMGSAKIGEFGAIPHKMLDVIGMAASVVCRPVISVCAWVVGGVCAVVVPPAKIAGRCVASAGEAAVCGLGWPMIKLVWNGTAWIATQVHTETPAEANSIMVTFKPEAKAPTGGKGDL